VASGTAPLSYQWQKNGTNISGATGSSYATPATKTSDNGSTFAVVVSNSAGSVTSASATLTVNAGSQKTYSTTFPLTENPISEGDNWINGGTVGLDWSDVRTTPGLAFGTINSSIANYGDSTAVLTGVWNPNQMAQAVVYSVNQTNKIHEEVELRLRTTITAHSITGYEVTFRCTSDGSQYVAIVRWNGALADFTYIANLTPGGPGIHNGDTVKATIIGNTITAYINGTQVLQGTDATYTSGNPGIGFDTESPTGSAVDADFGFTSFSAADHQ